jgi:hypothetical protein
MFTTWFDGDSDTVDFGQSSSFLAKVQKLYEPQALEAVAATGNVADEDAEIADTSLDDDIADPFTDLIEAGDESRDQDLVVSSANGDTWAKHGDGPHAGGPAEHTMATAAMPAAPEVRDFFAKLSVRREPDGKVVIEAPAEAASNLAALFEGMAALMTAVSQSKP